MSLVAKAKSRAEGLYEQAKTKYSDNDAMQKAGKQAGQAASQAGQAASQAGQAAGQAASQVADRLKGLASKTSSAVKDARAKGTSDK